MATTPIITNVYPSPGSTGIPVKDQIRVIFDQEMDLSTLDKGTIVISGPDTAPGFAPLELTPFDPPGQQDEEVLDSPYFKGYVKGTISFARVDNNGDPVSDSVLDISGDGTLWNTVAIFVPEKPLKPNVKYQVFVAGDEAPGDDFKTGVKTRTVFDTVSTGTGDSSISFLGGYTGSTSTGFTVEITTGGVTGIAEYIWWDQNDPLTTYRGITTTGTRELINGVSIECGHDGTFAVGDVFSVVVVPSFVLPNNYFWDYTTGSGSILTPPSSHSTSGIENIITNVIGLGESGLKVVSITPNDQATNLDPLDVSEIIVTFNKDIDPAIIDDDSVTIWSEPVNGDLNSNIQYAGDIAKIITVSGNKLTIQIS